MLIWELFQNAGSSEYKVPLSPRVYFFKKEFVIYTNVIYVMKCYQKNTCVYARGEEGQLAVPDLCDHLSFSKCSCFRATLHIYCQIKK